VKRRREFTDQWLDVFNVSNDCPAAKFPFLSADLGRGLHRFADNCYFSIIHSELGDPKKQPQVGVICWASSRSIARDLCGLRRQRAALKRNNGAPPPDAMLLGMAKSWRRDDVTKIVKKQRHGEFASYRFDGGFHCVSLCMCPFEVIYSGRIYDGSEIPLAVEFLRSPAAKRYLKQ
jgi:hypothetical protein